MAWPAKMNRDGDVIMDVKRAFPDSPPPIAPDSPRIPYWPVSTKLDPDFFRWHHDYVETP